MAVSRAFIGEEGVFTEADQIIIEMAARGESFKAMAAQSGVSERQIHRKLSERHYRDAVRDTCKLLWKNRLRKMQGHWDKMETCFTDILDNPEAADFAKIAAATQIRTICMQAADNDFEDEINELKEKIVAIERRISGHDGAPVVERLGHNGT
jgi:hypothetical protein